MSSTGVKFVHRPPNATPRMPDRAAMFSVAITTLMLAYGGMFGAAAIVIFYALWLPKLKYKGVRMIRPTWDIFIIAPFPLLACISAIWSKYPGTSLYTSLEYTSSIICAVVIARVVRTVPLIYGVVLGCTVVMAMSLASGRYGVDVFSGNYSLIGYFGSKNMVGLYAEIGIIFSGVALMLKSGLVKRVAFGFMPLGLFLITLYLSKSTSSLLSLIMVAGLLISLLIITRLPRAYRKFTFSIITVWFVVIAATGATLGWQDAVLKHFGKSSTLTGRTLLWEKGLEIGWNNPVLGIGYHGFWVKGNPEAEKLWYKFGIYHRSGFHFHNTFIEAFAELGIVGLVFVTLLLLANCITPLKLVLDKGLQPDYVLAVSLGVMFLIRAFVELDLMGTFGMAAVLFYMQIPRLATLRQEQYALAQSKANP